MAAAEELWYYLDANRERHGPIPLSEIQTQTVEGSIPADTLVARPTQPLPAPSWVV